MASYSDYIVGAPLVDTAAPDGSIETRWERRRFGVKLVNPANKRKMKVIVVGTGLAGGSAAATLAELGYQVSSFCYQDSPRRAHSIAAQGGKTDDPYNLMVDTFDLWWMTLIYLLAMVALAMHLRHGVWSAAQTLGLTNNARARRNANVLGVLVAVVIAGGFSLVPIFTFVGVIS